jgi:hypothetical protein
MKRSPKPISNLASAPVTGHSGGHSERPSRARIGAKFAPRPSTPSRTEMDPMGTFSSPAPISHSGGKNENSSIPHMEGTGNRPLNTKFNPTSRTAKKPISNLSMSDPIPHSDTHIRTKSNSGTVKRWTKRGYSFPTKVEGLGE